MEDKVLTKKELLNEMNKIINAYKEHCELNNLEGVLIAERINTFDTQMRICVNDFSVEVGKQTIPGTKIDWLCYYQGFLSGMQAGQLMTADTLGVGEIVREATGK